MPITNQTPVVTYVANGVTTSYSFNFKITASSDLKVYQDGAQVTTGFTASGIGNGTGGTVTFTVAPPNGALIRLQRKTSLDRQTDYLEGGSLAADSLDADFDRLVMMIQDIAQTPLLETSDGKFDAENKVIKNVATPVNPNDAATKTYCDGALPGFLAQATTQASNAAASALAADASASAAANSANLAANSAASSSDSAAASAASAAQVGGLVAQFPSLVSHGLKYVRINPEETAYEYRTNAQVLSDIGASAAGHNHAGTYEPVSAYIVKTNVSSTFTTQQVPSSGTLTDAASVAWDGDSSGQVVTLTTSASRTFAAPTNIKRNGLYVLILTTGGYTPSWNSAFKWPSGGTPTSLDAGVYVFTFIGGAGNTLIPTGPGYLTGA